MRLSLPALLLLAFLASAPAGAAPSLFYRSNAVGLALEPLARFDPDAKTVLGRRHGTREPLRRAACPL